MNADQLISIAIFGRTYQIKCPPEEAAQLQESAKLVDAEMRKINQSSQSCNIEKLVVVAALNIAHELKMHKNQKNSYIDMMHERIKSLQLRIQKFLGAGEKIPV